MYFVATYNQCNKIKYIYHKYRNEKRKDEQLYVHRIKRKRYTLM